MTRTVLFNALILLVLGSGCQSEEPTSEQVSEVSAPTPINVPDPGVEPLADQAPVVSTQTRDTHNSAVAELLETQRAELREARALRESLARELAEIRRQLEKSDRQLEQKQQTADSLASETAKP